MSVYTGLNTTFYANFSLYTSCIMSFTFLNVINCISFQTGQTIPHHGKCSSNYGSKQVSFVCLFFLYHEEDHATMTNISQTVRDYLESICLKGGCLLHTLRLAAAGWEEREEGKGKKKKSMGKYNSI